jgi:fermentation-respiration switch protein FrsA (DUF1100 family)
MDISDCTPTPLLMVIGTRDTITLTDLGLEAYERAREPKKAYYDFRRLFRSVSIGFRRFVRRSGCLV